MHHIQKTKIVATLGPHASSKEMIASMLESGMNVARCNMSHGDHDTHRALIRTARAAARATKRPLAILLDLCGPKIRIGDFSTETIELVPGEQFTLTTKRCVGDRSHAWVNYRKLPHEVTPHMYLYLDDGKVTLQVESTTATDVVTRIVYGGMIRGRRGVNVPDAVLSIETITEKDKRDLTFGLAEGVDMVTLSFVRSAKDIDRLRRLIGTAHEVSIVAKIETSSAIHNLDEIIAAADAIMVARGDLAIEVPPERVPLLQKRIIRAANQAGKPVITATQMLDSMRLSPVPTRAEVSDVANAILDGTDAIMLSDETAMGAHPDRTIRTMARIARETESDTYFLERQHLWEFSPHSTCDAVSWSISKSAAALRAKVIVAFSESGYSGRMVARYRPRMPILVLTPHHATFARSLLTYGCAPVLVRSVKDLAGARKIAREVLTRFGYGEGDVYILGAGLPFGKPGATNMLLIEHL